jgi:hypothetical protein
MRPLATGVIAAAETASAERERTAQEGNMGGVMGGARRSYAEALSEAVPVRGSVEFAIQSSLKPRAQPVRTVSWWAY